MKVFDNTLGTLERAMDVRLERQNVLAANIANADTPGYRARDIDVTQAMATATNAVPELPPMPQMEGTLVAPHRPEQASSAIASHAVPEGSAGLDGNSVDLDRTLVGLAENAVQYGAATRAASKKLAILRYVASDGNA